ncbi:hypothetical protein NQ317_004359 [Molorchus minor]|uniref:Ran-GTPase activating protein 1 C-terminal domain-containing protein n=1 Tax=Molorchus minor TaxID=1323400 RepID=A0ABQ9ITV0_9CUCU|nr:hypothetical protein NQ317_004359 [Molorchus minor]
MKEMGKLTMLGSLEDDESEDSDEDATASEVEEEESEQSEEEQIKEVIQLAKVTVDQFLANPSAQNFMDLGSNRLNVLLNKAKNNGNISVNDYVSVLMKVASLSKNTNTEAAELAEKCAELLYRDLFIWSQENDKTSIVNNTILVSLGLIKSEDKKYKPSWNLEGCLHTLIGIVKKNYIPESTKDAFKVFMQRQANDTVMS